MERATKGRRHTRAGSVTVADLVGKQTPALRVLHRKEEVTGRLGYDVPVPARVPVPESPTSRATKVARFAGYTAGALALFGSVAAASLITTRTQNTVLAAQSAPPGAITGATALRPDLLGGSLGATRQDRAPSAQSVSTPNDIEQQTMAAVDTPQAAPQVTPESSTEAPVSTDLPVEGPPENTEIVTQFYRLVGSRPAAAFALIDPGLLGADPSGFISSWSAVRAVKVERVEARPPNSVLAVVCVQQPDGKWLRVEQLLRTSRSTPPRITSAEILSAQLG